MSKTPDISELCRELALIDVQRFRAKLDEYRSGGLASTDHTRLSTHSHQNPTPHWDPVDRRLNGIALAFDAELRTLKASAGRLARLYTSVVDLVRLPDQTALPSCEHCNHQSHERLRKGLCFACYRTQLRTQKETLDTPS